MLCSIYYEYANELFHIHFHQLLSRWVVIGIDDEASPFAVNLLFPETEIGTKSMGSGSMAALADIQHGRNSGTTLHLLPLLHVTNF